MQMRGGNVCQTEFKGSGGGEEISLIVAKINNWFVDQQYFLWALSNGFIGGTSPGGMSGINHPSDTLRKCTGLRDCVRRSASISRP